MEGDLQVGTDRKRLDWSQELRELGSVGPRGRGVEFPNRLETWEGAGMREGGQIGLGHEESATC